MKQPDKKTARKYVLTLMHRAGGKTTQCINIIVEKIKAKDYNFCYVARNHERTDRMLDVICAHFEDRDITDQIRLKRRMMFISHDGLKTYVAHPDTYIIDDIPLEMVESILENPRICESSSVLMFSSFPLLIDLITSRETLNKEQTKLIDEVLQTNKELEQLETKLNDQKIAHFNERLLLKTEIFNLKEQISELREREATAIRHQELMAWRFYNISLWKFLKLKREWKNKLDLKIEDEKP